LGAKLRFRMLGALNVRAGGVSLPLGSPRQRVVLAMLLLSADRVVSTDTMVEAVWNGCPPTTSRTQIAICIAALRKAFKNAGCTDEVIVTVSPGYLLRSAGHWIDAVEFAAYLEQAQAAAAEGRDAEATVLVDKALALWHGPALAGVSGYLVEGDVGHLEELRLTAQELQARLKLGSGQGSSLIGELSAMVREHPLHEQFRAHLMLAQYRAGRRAEALETFRDGRRQLIEEIGMEPGPALGQLHHAILADEPMLTLLPVLGPRLGAEILVPAQLPPEQPGFIGRTAQLSTLDGLMEVAAGGNSLGTAVVTGSAGVGKSALTLHWAHHAAARFPDGQLFADMRGYEQEAAPSDPGEVLGSFLRALGVVAECVPSDLDERVTLYRSILDGRSVLIILDSVRTVDQVLPLLPGNGRCCVVITSRSRLSGLLDRAEVVRVQVNAMPTHDANALLARAVGDDRVVADHDGAVRVGELCGRLPLALRISAERLAAKPHWTVQHLVRRLEDHRTRLDELAMDEVHLRGRFEPSYRLLNPDAAVMYRRLGLLDVPDFAAWVGAALLDTSPDRAEYLIEQLVDAQLLGVSADRNMVHYEFPELFRLHAREHAVREESDLHRRAAKSRVLNARLTIAIEAHRREYGHTLPTGRFRPRARDEFTCTFTDDYLDLLLDEPGRWLAREHELILAAISQAEHARLSYGLLATAQFLFVGTG
jgi:DNA-binding SARP family transcriptional activator